MAKFRCLLSGNIVEFTQQVDIDSMVGHEGYEKVTEDGEQEVAVVQEPAHVLPLVKPRGRPAKNKQGD
jgi:hypothetical protein